MHCRRFLSDQIAELLILAMDTYNSTHFWLEQERRHLHAVLIVDTFSLVATLQGDSCASVQSIARFIH
jgi:hypothetical protein